KVWGVPPAAPARGGCPPPRILLGKSLGMPQQAADFLPHRHFHYIGAHLRVRTDPLPAKAVGVGSQTAIIRIGAGMAFATAGANRLAIVRIATHLADQRPLEQVARPPLALPRSAAILF